MVIRHDQPEIWLTCRVDNTAEKKKNAQKYSDHNQEKVSASGF
ncbi:MAG: hypothetical protein ACJASX_000623 [Limisphaerales bacterium]|jgi:hypothetical protein